jgi:hypothetical protein
VERKVVDVSGVPQEDATSSKLRSDRMRVALGERIIAKPLGVESDGCSD